MTEDETRPDPALVDVVARLVLCNLWRPNGQDWWPAMDDLTRGSFRAQASAVLTALSAAGRLLPEGGETRTLWRSHDLTSGGSITTRDRAQAQRFVDRSRDPFEPNHENVLESSTVTTWPDGSTYTSAWREVDHG
jgi:hypothetical protein